MCRFLPPRQANDSMSKTSQSMGTGAHAGGLDGCKDAVKYTWWLLLVWSGSSSSLSIAPVVSSRDFKVTVGRSHALVQVVGWSRLLYFGSHQWGQERMFMPGYPCFWQSFMGLFINLEKIVGQLRLSLNMHHCCCLPSRFTFAQCFAVRIFPFCPAYPLLRHTDGKDKVFHFEDSVRGAEVDP